MILFVPTSKSILPYLGASNNYFVTLEQAPLNLLCLQHLLLGLHPPVLEPDLDLSLRQSQVVSDLYPPPPSQVAVKVELLQSQSQSVEITILM